MQDVARGRDGLVRKTMVRTNSGMTNRPINKRYTTEVNEIDYALRRRERTSEHNFTDWLNFNTLIFVHRHSII